MTPHEKQMRDLAEDANRVLQSFEENSELLNELLGFDDLNEYFLNPEDEDFEA